MLLQTAHALEAPDGVSAQLDYGRDRTALYDVRALQSYYDWKENLSEEHGLTLGLNTFFLAQKSDETGSGGDDLGGHVQFRTLIGVGYRLSTNRRISLAADHLSNAGLKDRNPGRNALLLRYAISF